MKYLKLKNNTASKFLLVGAALVLTAFVIMAIFGSALAPQDASAQTLSARLLEPGSSSAAGLHVLGTDALGRDMLSLILAGAQSIITIAAMAVLIGAVAGTALGMIGGFVGGRLGDVLVLLTNMQLAFPFFLLALTVVGILGPSFWIVVLVVALGTWVEFARVIYAETVQIRQLEYIQAVKVMRGSSLRSIVSHVLPNVMPTVIVLSTFALGTAIVVISGLGFVGLSVPASSPDWGQVLSDGRDYVVTAWWVTGIPGFAIFLLVLSVNLVGESVRDRLNPGSKR